MTFNIFIQRATELSNQYHLISLFILFARARFIYMHAINLLPEYSNHSKKHNCCESTPRRDRSLYLFTCYLWLVINNIKLNMELQSVLSADVFVNGKINCTFAFLIQSRCRSHELWQKIVSALTENGEMFKRTKTRVICYFGNHALLTAFI